jgi:uracil-DNA glycosylase family 4
MEGIFSRTELEIVKAPAHRLPQCGACGLLKTCNTPKMPVAGSGRKRIMVVGEAPGETEDIQGKPFVGKSGEELQKALRYAGIDLFKDCWVTNALSCRPPANKIDDKKAVAYCRPLVTAALEKYDPEVVLLVGKSAVESVIQPWFGDIDAMARWVGQRIPHIATNRWLCPTWHPSYLMREKKDAGWDLFREHVAAACELPDRPYNRQLPDYLPDYEAMCAPCVDTEDAARWLGTLKYKRGIAFDFETFCLRPESPEAGILCCSASDGVTSIAFPWAGQAVKAMEWILTNPDIPKFAQNMKFEDRWCRRKLGIRVKGWKWDSMLGSHLLDPRTGTSGLDFQAFTKLGIRDYWSRVIPYMEGNRGKFGANAPNKLKKVDLKEVLQYCALDSLYEHILCTKQMKELQWPLH